MEERTRRILGVALIALGLFTALDGWIHLTYSYALLSTYGGGCDVYVVDEAGVPVGGATVTVLGVTLGDYYYDLNLPAGTSDAAGYVSFGISGDGTYRIKAERNGLEDIQEVYIGGGGVYEVTLTLQEADPGTNDPGNNDDPTNKRGMTQAPLLMGGLLIAIGVVTIDPDRVLSALRLLNSSLFFFWVR